MATGNTQGIIDGTTKTFRGFAYQCVRNFGAAIHMRDEPLSEEYRPREMSGASYHIEAITNSELELEALEKMTDEELVEETRKNLLTDFEYQRGRIREINSQNTKLNKFLEKAKAFKPPTEDHNGIAEFMIDQLEKTIIYNNIEFNVKSVLRILESLEDINAEEIRESRRTRIKESMSYHLKQQSDEHKRVVEANKWVNDFFDSIEEMEDSTTELV